MRKSLIVGALLGTAVAVFGQGLGPVISAWYELPSMAAPLYKWLHVDAPLTLAVDAAGSPHLGLAPAHFGPGFIGVTDASGNLIQLNLDTAYVSFRTLAPTGPGPCVSPVSPQEEGSGAWAADSTGLYVCIPNTPTPTPTTKFIWAKVPLVTTW